VEAALRDIWQALLLGGLRARELALDFLFPAQCLGCGKAGVLLCPSCLQRIEYTPANVCWRCGRPQPAPRLCPACARTPSPLARVYAVTYSTGVMRRAIHRLKYAGQSSLAEPLGDLLAGWWRAHPLRADLIAPVPLHPRRERQRGFNQSALLARRLSRGVGVPCVEDALHRARDTRSQVGLNAAERAQNMAGAFVCESGAVCGRRIILMDDVCTTGATLAACAAALKDAGAAEVWGLTLARAKGSWSNQP